MYFGPGKSSGYLIYGNGPNQSMNGSVRQKKGVVKYALPSLYQLQSHLITDPLCASYSTRYFTAQNGKELKWKITEGRMEVCALLFCCSLRPAEVRDRHILTTSSRFVVL